MLIVRELKKYLLAMLNWSRVAWRLATARRRQVVVLDGEGSEWARSSDAQSPGRIPPDDSPQSSTSPVQILLIVFVSWIVGGLAGRRRPHRAARVAAPASVTEGRVRR